MPDAKARCLETRATPEGFKKRRYETPAGARYSTIEVPLSVWNSINMAGRSHDRAAQHARRVARDEARRRALDQLLAGTKPLAVSSDLGIPVRTLNRWLQEARS